MVLKHLPEAEQECVQVQLEYLPHAEALGFLMR